MLKVVITLLVMFMPCSLGQRSNGDGRRPQHVVGPEFCPKTSSDVLGPYYFPDFPENRPDDMLDICVGDSLYSELPTLKVEGKVLSEGCEPLEGARIEVWQADHDGVYELRDYCRGYIYSDDEGDYSLSTIHPGKYRVDGSFRPAHVHFRVQLRGYKILVTQMYFEGDLNLGRNDSCTACQSDKRDLVVPTTVVCPTENADDCYDKATFNIVLSRASRRNDVDVVPDIDDTESELVDKVIEGK